MKEDLKKILKDKLARDVLDFFYNNQASIDTVGGVSAWVHGDREQVKEILEKLVALGVLEGDSTGAARGYCYTRDEKTMKTVSDILKEGS